MAAKFEIVRDKALEFQFRLKAANGEVIASSEGYKSKTAAERGSAASGQRGRSRDGRQNRLTRIRRPSADRMNCRQRLREGTGFRRMREIETMDSWINDFGRRCRVRSVT